MKVFITVKPRSKHSGVTQVDKEHFVIAVVEPPVDGKANDAVIKMLADHLQISPSQVAIVSGHKGRKKVVALYL
jgi:uncharacterized protein